MGKNGGLEDKVTRIVLATISGAACAYAGFAVGWSRARGIPLEYESLMTYGPTLLSAGMFGAYGGVEAYAQALKEPRLPNPLLFAGKTAFGSAAMGGFLGSYNLLCFGVVGYVAGIISR